MQLRLLRQAPTNTRVFADGFLVQPLVTTALDVRIGAGGTTAAPDRRGSILQAAPNPFNPRTVLAFELTAPAAVRLAIVDLAGRHVRTLATGPLPAGTHQRTWNGRDDAGRAVAAGVYLARLLVDGRPQVRRVTLVR